MIRKVYLIEWEDELGIDCLNLPSLLLCLFTDSHVGPYAKDKIKITDVEGGLNPGRGNVICEENYGG